LEDQWSPDDFLCRLSSTNSMMDQIPQSVQVLVRPQGWLKTISLEASMIISELHEVVESSKGCLVCLAVTKSISHHHSTADSCPQRRDKCLRCFEAYSQSHRGSSWPKNAYEHFLYFLYFFYFLPLVINGQSIHSKDSWGSSTNCPFKEIPAAVFAFWRAKNADFYRLNPDAPQTSDATILLNWLWIEKQPLNIPRGVSVILNIMK